jgi:hypothetical protein
MVMDCGQHTVADASGDIFDEWVHHSLLLFCLHPVKMAEPVQRSLSPGVSVVRFASWPVQGSQPWGIARTRAVLLSRSGLRITFCHRRPLSIEFRQACSEYSEAYVSCHNHLLYLIEISTTNHCHSFRRDQQIMRQRT